MRFNTKRVVFGSVNHLENLIDQTEKYSLALDQFPSSSLVRFGVHCNRPKCLVNTVYEYTFGVGFYNAYIYSRLNILFVTYVVRFLCGIYFDYSIFTSG